MKQSMKRLVSFFLALMLMISVVPATAFAAEGEGTETWASAADTSWYDAKKTEFGIDSAEKLAGLAAIVNGEGDLNDNFEGDTIVLCGDIDLAGKEWTPIGTSSNTFNGVFDGNGYGVSNITITNGGSFTGFFGKTNGAVIRDFKVESGSITGTMNGGYVGSIVAQAQATTIKKVSNAATVTKTSNNSALGGIVGSLDAKSAISNAYNRGAVNATGNMNAGGIVGESATSAIENLYNTGAITTNSTQNWKYTSGIVGTFTSYSGLSVKNCYNAGTISGGGTAVSGIAGSYNSISMENSFFLKDAGATYANAKKTTDGADAAKTVEELKGETVLTALGAAFVADSDTVNGGYPVLKWEKEELIRGFASSILICTQYAENGIAKKSDWLVKDFEHNKFEYTIEVPANVGDLIIGGSYRADAPEDLSVKVEYYDYLFKDNWERDLTSVFQDDYANGLYMGSSMSRDGTNTPNTFKITLSIDDVSQTYTINALRTPVIKSIDIVDKEGVSLKVEKQDEKDIYMVPADTKEVGFTVDATDAALTINGEEAVNGEVFKVTPSYDVDGYAEVTAAAAYDDRTVTKTYTLYQDTEMASVYEEAAASKAEAEAAKKEAELAKAEAEAAKKAAEEAAKAAKEAKEAVEKNNTAEAKKAAAKAEAEAAKKAEEAAKAEAEAAKKAETAAKAEAEAAKKEAETAKSELAKAKFNHSSVKLTSVKAGKKKITLRWKKVKDADGYVIYRSTKKNKEFKKVKTIKKDSTVKWTNTKLKANKRYYYKVRAYKVVDGKNIYTQYSAVKQAKAK